MSELLDTSTAGAESLLVRFPQFLRVQEEIDLCRTRSKNSAEPKCMIVHGPSGTGKSTHVRVYAQSLEKTVKESDQQVHPVLSAELPIPATIGNMVGALLQGLGDPAPDKGTIQARTRRLLKLITDLRVELIILDEFQHLIDRDNHRVLREAADWLKSILNHSRVPIVLFGTDECLGILKVNEQLRRRFRLRLRLEPYDWRVKESRKAFRRLLEELDRVSGLKYSGLSAADTAFLIYQATSGLIGYIMDLIREAIYIAQRDSAPHITREILSVAFERAVGGTNPDHPNPFEAGAASHAAPVMPGQLAQVRDPKLPRGARSSDYLR